MSSHTSTASWCRRVRLERLGRRGQVPEWESPAAHPYSPRIIASASSGIIAAASSSEQSDASENVRFMHDLEEVREKEPTSTLDSDSVSDCAELPPRCPADAHCAPG